MTERDYENLIPSVIQAEEAQPISSLSAQQRDKVQYSFEEGAVRVREELSPEKVLQASLQPVMSLSEIERRVVQMRFGIVEGGAQPLSLRAIAAALGIPKSTIFDTEKRAIRNLSQPSRPRG